MGAQEIAPVIVCPSKMPCGSWAPQNVHRSWSSAERGQRGAWQSRYQVCNALSTWLPSTRARVRARPSITITEHRRELLVRWSFSRRKRRSPVADNSLGRALRSCAQTSAVLRATKSPSTLKHLQHDHAAPPPPAARERRSYRSSRERFG